MVKLKAAENYRKDTSASVQEEVLELQQVRLFHGGTLSKAIVKYKVFGNEAGPAVVILGGISADCNVCSSKEASGWWSEITARSGAIDAEKYRIISVEYVAPEENLLISSLDQAYFVKEVINNLGIEKLSAFIGSSYGGLVGMAFASRFPDLLDCLITVCAANESEAKAVQDRVIQRNILKQVSDKTLAVELARSIAICGYRGSEEFGTRFSNKPEIDGQNTKFAIESYIEHNTKKFAKRFDANRYLKLSESIDLHDVDLKTIECDCLLIGFDSDQIVSQTKLYETSKTINAATLEIVRTPFGHDAFLLEQKKIGDLIKSYLKSISNGKFDTE